MAKHQKLKEQRPERPRVSKSNVMDPSIYEIDDCYRPTQGVPRTIPEIAQYLKENKNSSVDCLLLAGKKEGGFKPVRIKERAEFLKAFQAGGPKFKLRESQLKEAVDYFGTDQDNQSTGAGGLVGDDYVPLLGGPFSKQLYMYDALRMFALAFQVYHHDPVARAIAHITRDFTLGRGFRVDSENKSALALWRAFEAANNLQAFFETMAVELCLFGEVMLWWLPNNQTKIVYNLKPGDKVPTGIIPRIRLIDPSTCWEIITYPEDITRVISYRLVYPTQYQIYTTPEVPSTKFIIQDIPADQVQHHKINCVSNEKRGRSDFFPAFGYLKRLRDSVNYSVIAMQKSVAWSMDTTIEGSQADIDAYVENQQSQGTIPPAGSEFVHTSKIKREYLSNSAGDHGGKDSAFEWCLNMIAAAVQIPVNYFGTHLSGGSARASALVATEPVAKKFENRQQTYERIIQGLWKKLMEQFGIDADCEVTFPEVIVQDRSQKIKDIKISEDCGYISRERAATMASKELGITEFEWQIEQQNIDTEAANEKPISPNIMGPLTAPALKAPSPSDSTTSTNAPSAVTSQDRKAVMDRR